jgi:hypothetical protein
MKHPTTTLSACLLAALGVACSPSVAGDSWNEAIQTKNGKRTVDLPPKGGVFGETPPADWEPPIPLVSYVLEGPQELVECVQPYFLGHRTCQAYRPGMYTKKRKRAWVLKRGGQWLVCPEQKAETGCVGLYTAAYPPFKAQD